MNVNARLYRAKAWECLSLTENMNDPERRADMLRFAQAWLSLTEPIGDLPIPRSPDTNAGDVIGRPSGNSTAYAHRRLRRHRPDIHARIFADEITAFAAHAVIAALKNRGPPNPDGAFGSC